MPESFIRLPQDGIGRRVRSRQWTVGGNDVEEQYVIALLSTRVLTTRYLFHSGALVVGASADGTNVGRFYLVNHPGSGVTIALRHLQWKSQLGSALATPTSPRFVLRFFTFTGTPSGAQLTGVKQDSMLPDKSDNWSLRTANTGMTITEGADLASFLPVASATAASYLAPAESSWPPTNWELPLILNPGEGVMLKQVEAGTSSDTRRATADLIVDEFTVP